jgi:phosphonate transport system substrate-binding protein
MKRFNASLAFCAIAASLSTPAPSALAADACKYRGDLDERYCDENRDLVADLPTDPKKLKDPPFLLFTIRRSRIPRSMKRCSRTSSIT